MTSKVKKDKGGSTPKRSKGSIPRRNKATPFKVVDVEESDEAFHKKMSTSKKSKNKFKATEKKNVPVAQIKLMIDDDEDLKQFDDTPDIFWRGPKKGGLKNNAQRRVYISSCMLS